MQAYFNSPRARWTLRLLSNILFVILFMQAGAAGLVPGFGYDGI